MKKNRILILVFAFALFIGLLSGCDKNSSVSDVCTDFGKTGSEKVSIVCTTFPQYDWVREIIGEKSDQFELTLLLDNGVDLHSYQPTAEDISRIVSSDIFIYVGGESDKWVDDALRESSNKNIKAVNMLEILGDGAKEEESVEGMEKEENDDEEDGKDYDEHVWLSLKNAKILISDISNLVQSVDTKDAAVFEKNTSNYLKKLDVLDEEYRQTVQFSQFNTLLFGDRFPFRYLAEDYDLNYYAAFKGCSSETEASFETITFLAGKVDDLGLTSILTIENSNQKIAETIKQNTIKKNQNILTMNSLQSVTGSDVDSGVTYLKAMQDNLEVLKKALN